MKLHNLTTVEMAIYIATHAHRNQVRKYTGDPYIVHPKAVAESVRAIGGSEIMVAAAWLHDVVEDTDITTYLISHVLGDTVAQYVYFLTDAGGPGNRASRKAAYALKLKGAPNEVKTIKLADLIDNTSDILEHDPKFARVYLAEKRELLEVLKGGNMQLWQKANTQIAQGLLKLTYGGQNEQA